VVEAFAAEGADETFGNRVRPRCPDRGADDADVGGGKDTDLRKSAGSRS
jgi:hypothetical protein